MAVGLGALACGALTPGERIYCPGFIDLGSTRFHCWRKGGHGSLDFKNALKHSCDVFFFEAARRAGIDAVAASANRFGLGTQLPIDLPGARAGLIPDAAWRARHRRHWGPGDTVNCGIGQGVIQATPLQLATYVSRLAPRRAGPPPGARAHGGGAQPGATADEYPVLDVPENWLALAREGMFAVVNEAGGTAPHARLNVHGALLAGKTGSSQVRHVSRWTREHGHFNSASLPWQFRPHALFVCFAPYDAPRYAMSVVIEHGNAGADVAAPLAREIMRDTLLRDPSRRSVAPGQTVAERS
jgi:penicillin-binding protein 2